MFKQASRRTITGLIALGVLTALVTATAPANAATTAAPAHVVATRAAASEPAAPHMTITRSSSTSSSKGSAASPKLVGFCLTAWSGRFVYSHCEGIGPWRQWADCSFNGFTYTSPLLFAPPIYDWYGACPVGQAVITAGAQI